MLLDFGFHACMHGCMRGSRCSVCSTIESRPVMLCWVSAFILEISSITVPSVCSAYKRGHAWIGRWIAAVKLLKHAWLFRANQILRLKVVAVIFPLALINSTWNFEDCPHHAWCLDRSACVSTGNVSCNRCVYSEAASLWLLMSCFQSMLCSGLLWTVGVFAVVANCINMSIQSCWALPLRQSASSLAVDCAY